MINGIKLWLACLVLISLLISNFGCMARCEVSPEENLISPKAIDTHNVRKAAQKAYGSVSNLHEAIILFKKDTEQLRMMLQTNSIAGEKDLDLLRLSMELESQEEKQLWSEILAALKKIQEASEVIKEQVSTERELRTAIRKYVLSDKKQ